MFHCRDNLYFGRTADSSVRIIKFPTAPESWPSVDHEGVYPDACLDLTIPENEWASIVCSVSKNGETSERWNQARDFHGHDTP